MAVHVSTPVCTAATWFGLFKDLDADNSGHLTFEELRYGVRERLRLKASELSDARLKALWVSLDADSSGYLESSEFSKFMQREESVAGAGERRGMLQRQKTKAKIDAMDAALQEERVANRIFAGTR